VTPDTDVAAPGPGAPPGGPAAAPPSVSTPSAASHDASETRVGAGNWKGVGMWAWLLHRVTGLILVFYLFAHIWVISHAQSGAGSFDKLFKTLENPLFVLADVALVGTVLYHAFNGVRIILFDFGVGIEQHKVLYYVLMTLAAVVLVVFAVAAFAFLARRGTA
jgi:succinate dehydrogenase / fumarate reductase cytochrome b subunit